MSIRLSALASSLMLLASCSISQVVTPVTFAPTASRQVCIIENAATRSTFLEAYQRQLESRGFETRVVPARSPVTACPVTTTYVARWSWDVTIYMSYADLRIYHNGRYVGRALYDARNGGARLDKWVDADAKIGDLVDQLFQRA